MLINEVAQLTGFSKDTIRYYEKIGLIELPNKSRLPNNYKNYPQQVVTTLLSIRNLKKLGFTLEEIREIIVRQQVDALDHGAAIKIIEQKLIHLDTQIDKLLLYKHRLALARLHMKDGKLRDITHFTDISLCA